MKLRILIGFLLAITIVYSGNSQTIVYQQSIVIDESVLEEKDSTAFLNKDSTLEDLQEQKQFDEKLAIWIDNLAATESKMKYFYTIGVKAVRYRREDLRPGLLFSEEWILINRESRIMHHYYLDDTKGPQKTEFPLDRTLFRDLEVSYERREDRNDKKTILGFVCHRVVVTEKITDQEYGTEILEYDMYVTDQIGLPFHLLNTTLKPIEALCPLQMIIRKIDKGKTYSTMNAIEILTGKEADQIELPTRFKLE